MAKILLVDDEKEMAGYMKSSLEKRGYEVLLALSGQEALSLYTKENPGAVLLDLGLPDMDGRDVLKDIKAKAGSIKVIVISGYKDQTTRNELISLGADYFLGKPIIPQELYEILRGIFNQ